MGDLVNTFSTSLSRLNVFKACPRQYYWRAIGFWPGWEHDASARTRLAYRLSKMFGLRALAGIVVHDEIVIAIEDQHSSLERAQTGARRVMVDAWRAAKAERWRQNPKRWPPLAELYYLHEDPDVVSRAAWAALETSLRNAWGCTEFSEAREATGAGRLVALEELAREGDGPALVLEGVPLWVKLDAAYRDNDGRLVIVDWKTARPKRADEIQALVYALFAHEARGVAVDELALRIVYLAGEGPRRVEITPSAEHLAEVRADIIRKAQETCDLLPNPDLNEAPIEAFPITNNRRTCRWCDFFHVCKGHRDREAADEDHSEEVDWNEELAS